PPGAALEQDRRHAFDVPRRRFHRLRRRLPLGLADRPRPAALRPPRPGPGEEQPGPTPARPGVLDPTPGGRPTRTVLARPERVGCRPTLGRRRPPRTAP